MYSKTGMITKDELRLAFELCGIKKGDIILMHSALSAVGHVEDGPDGIIEAITDVLGEEGTFAVSTMNGDNPFDAKTSPSTVGIISETLRKYPNAYRSLRPVHSVTAVGKYAKEFTEGHDKAETNCGEGTPFTKLRDMHGYVLLLGVDMNRNTTLHAIEDIMNSHYLETRTIPAPTYVEDHLHKTMTMTKFPPGHRDFLKFTNVLRRAGAIKNGVVGHAEALLIDAEKMFELGIKMLGSNEDYFLCENEACEHCIGKINKRKESLASEK